MVKKVVTGNYAAAFGAMRARADVVAAFPITPQTFIVEHISEFVNDGLMDTEFIRVESEHSAMSACVSAVAAGARAFTATASQGLALMHEILFIPPALRLPMVMPIVNRTVAAPIGIWCEYNDAMPQRDCGWLQVFCEDNQEVFDMVLQSYRIAEHKDVLLPVMVNLDAFYLSHTVEPVDLAEPEEADRFLPKYKPYAKLWPEEPMTIGTFTPPEYIQEVRWLQDKAMRDSLRVIGDVNKEFAGQFGRDYHGAIEEYRTDDAEAILITTGTVTSTARSVIDGYRERGKKVGLIKLRFFRPFPMEAIRKATENASAIGVYDRSVSFGSGGPIFIEARHALYGSGKPIINFLAGLGGRDVMTPDVELMLDRTIEAAEGGKAKKDIVWIGTRGVEP